MNTYDGAKAILQELVKIAAEEGRLERARLGRDLTEAEAQQLAAMIERQFATAMVMVRTR